MSERMTFRNVPHSKWNEMEATVRLLKNSGIKIKPKEGQSHEQAVFAAAYKMIIK